MAFTSVSSEHEQSLLTWINSFDITTECSSLSQIHDGITLFEICAQVAPKHFSLSLLKRDVGDNWLLKQQNLRSLILKLDTFYSESLGQKVNLADIDIPKLSKEGDLVEVAKLTEVVLGIAVQCRDKEKYIQRIVALDHDAQSYLMRAIERIMKSVTPIEKRAPDSPTGPPSPEHSTLADDGGPTRSDGPRQRYEDKDEVSDAMKHTLDTLKREYSELERKYFTLDSECTTLKEEKAELNEKLIKTEHSLLNEQETAERTHRNASGVAAELDFLRAKVAEDEQSLVEAKRKMKEADALVQQNRSLKDEYDVLREKVASVDRLEATLAKYKKRVDDVVELKRQLRDVQTKNNEYAETNLDLSEQVSRIAPLKAQIEMYKQAVVELEQKSADAALYSESRSQEVQKLRVQCMEFQQDAARHAAEAADLGRRLELALEFGSDIALERDDKSGGGTLSDELVTPARRRLSTSEGLRQHLTDASEISGQNRIIMLENMLDDARRLKEKMQKDYTSARQDVLHLEAEKETLGSKLKGENEILTERLASAQREAKKLHMRVSEVNKELASKQHETDIAYRAMAEAQDELVTVKTQLSLVGSEERDRVQSATSQIEKRMGDETSRMSKKVEELEKEVRELSKENEKLEVDRDRLASEVDELKVESNAHMKELHALLRDKDSISNELIKSREQAVDRERLLAEMQGAVATKNTELGRLTIEVEQLKERVAKTSSGDVPTLGVSDTEIELLRLKLERGEGLLSEARAKVAVAQAERARLADDKARLEAYLKQAKLLIQEYKTKSAEAAQRESAQLEEKFGEAIAALQTQLMQKEKEMKTLKQSRDNTGAEQRREEHLVMSAFYEMGLELMRLKAPSARTIGSPLTSPGRPVPQSWLAKQRAKI